ncbi:hypothetical protein GOP47_0001465 [Adiantum capillus-veneris]|uniref:Uncharacterized protein n=1 Tax=Adiantum capillus-veneris TaxID=13818 RepID=A0A9D4V8X5_ADICA|nr:hypothetical protein GOP47_0001465 [Adiantum capillus-veneris]
MEMRQDVWPDHLWMTSGGKADMALRLPYILTDTYQVKEMQPHHRLQYRAVIDALTRSLPRLVDNGNIAYLLGMAKFCMNVFLNGGLYRSTSPSQRTAFAILVPMFGACDVLALRKQIQRHLLLFNCRTTTDMMRYLDIAFTDPRSPELSELASAMDNRFIEFEEFHQVISRYLSILYGIQR